MKYPKKETKKSGAKLPQGNRTTASSDYKDPIGSNENISTPQNSGYDEKQPTTDKKPSHKSVP